MFGEHKKNYITPSSDCGRWGEKFSYCRHSL